MFKFLTAWQSAEVSPRQLQRMHGWLTVTWALVIPIGLIFGWIYSVAFISVISIYANVAGHFSSWQAARTEVEQEKQKEKLEQADI